METFFLSARQWQTNAGRQFGILHLCWVQQSFTVCPLPLCSCYRANVYAKGRGSRTLSFKLVNIIIKFHMR